MVEKGSKLEQKLKFANTEKLAVDQVVYNWFYKAKNKANKFNKKQWRQQAV